MQKLQQFYVLKFNSGRLKKDKYNININIKTARKNGELIALGDNQVLRSIRKIKGRKVDFDFINELFKERRKITRRNDCTFKHCIEQYIPVVSHKDIVDHQFIIIPKRTKL